MKRIIPILVAGILVFSGLGIVNVIGNELSTSQKLQPEVKILDIIGGLFVVEATVRNVGDEDAIIDSVKIVIDAPIMLLGRNTDITKPINLRSGVTIAVVSDLVIGLGSCTITYTLNIRNHGTVTATANGFVFGPFILIKESFLSI